MWTDSRGLFGLFAATAGALGFSRTTLDGPRALGSHGTPRHQLVPPHHHHDRRSQANARISCAGLRSRAQLLQSCLTLCNPWTIQSVKPPGQNTGVHSPSTSPRHLPTPGSNPGLLHCSQLLYQPSHHGRPRILHWVASPCSRGSWQPKNQSGLSCMASRFFTS